MGHAFGVAGLEGRGDADDEQYQLMQMAHQTNLANISEKNRELVPIFSSQVIARYEQFRYKGLEVDLMQKVDGEEGSQKTFAPLEKGLVGIASKYEGDDEGQSKF